MRCQGQSRSNRRKVNMSVSKESDGINIPTSSVPGLYRPKRIIWKDRDMIHLWMAYKRHPVLWNTNIPEFRNEASRQAAFAEIAKCIPNKPFLTAADVEFRMKSLLSLYLHQRSYYLDCERLSLESRTKRYWYALADDFLQPFAGTLRSSIGVHRGSSRKYSGSDDDDGNKKAKTMETAESITQDENTEFSATQPASLPSSKKNEVTNQEDLYPVQFTHSAPKSYQKRNKEKEEDEFDFFGRAIAIQLRKFPLPKALLLHQELLAMMNKAVVRSVNKQAEVLPGTNVKDIKLKEEPVGNESEDEVDGDGYEEYAIKPEVVLTGKNITNIQLKEEPIGNESEDEEDGDKNEEYAMKPEVVLTDIKVKDEPVGNESEDEEDGEGNEEYAAVIKIEEDSDTYCYSEMTNKEAAS